MIYIFLANGFEECEALAPIDILRRADIKIKTVGIGSKTVTGSHGIPIVCDLSEDELTTDSLKGIILPGGMPGTLNLEKSKTVQRYIDFAAENELLIGAICAAPSILGHKNLLNGKKATCFTGFEKDLIGAITINEPVVRDGNFVTAYGAGAAFQFGFTLLEALTDSETAEKMRLQMRYK
ncbi:MAG: DJ-1 family glyoxalase III [Acutalibacteraceae bacterium]|nr:DJ-1 family glyoxalase III [Acutalibacteraceae bacterium]